MTLLCYLSYTVGERLAVCLSVFGGRFGMISLRVCKGLFPFLGS